VLTAFAVAAVVLSAGCRTVVTVDVVGEEDGSGEVTVTAELDAEAATALGGADRLVLDDVVEAGWDVDEVETLDDGGLRVAGTRTFRDGDELEAVLDEIGTGANGTSVFSGTDYQVGDSFGRTTYEMVTTVEVSGDPVQFGDDALTAVLDGVPLGWTPEQLAAIGATDAGAGELLVTLTVPEGGTDTARVDLTGAAPSEERVEAESARTEPLVWVLAALGVVLVLAAAALAFRAWRARS
jgi:hypothetical protein